MMPYITAFFMPRADGDRPLVVPEGAVNFAFIGQFAETPRDTIFTTEYSMRTGMEAVYTLLDIDRGVPEVWGSVFDLRVLLNATVLLRDGKPATDMNMNVLEKLLLSRGLKEIEHTDIYGLRRSSASFRPPMRTAMCPCPPRVPCGRASINPPLRRCWGSV
ncbi:MAG: oleate hydratase [Adlercreutzia equolifaciens]